MAMSSAGNIDALEMEVEPLTPKVIDKSKPTNATNRNEGQNEVEKILAQVKDKINELLATPQGQKLMITYEELRRKTVLKAKELHALFQHYTRTYPTGSKVAGVILALLFLKVVFFRHRKEVRYIPPHLQEHFGDIDGYYNLQTARIDHWCLTEGSDKCKCEDPTQPGPRSGNLWEIQRLANVDAALSAGSDLDVTFLGDQIVQAWTGNKRGVVYGKKDVSQYFNDHFHIEGGRQGIALGIADDQIGHLHYRILHGELPKSSKIYWINIGLNDLVVGRCSEEAVTLGILKLADRINYKRPGTVIVLQGLLPQSPFADGSLDSERGKVGNSTKRAKSEYYKEDSYPLWPSIVAINRELEHFCSKQDHLVYFDPDALFLGSVGNGFYQSSKKQILPELMPDFAHLSTEGYQVMTEVIADQITSILEDGNEDNTIIKKGK